MHNMVISWKYTSVSHMYKYEYYSREKWREIHQNQQNLWKLYFVRRKNKRITQLSKLSINHSMDQSHSYCCGGLVLLFLPSKIYRQIYHDLCRSHLVPHLPLREVAVTDPTQKTCPRPCRWFGSQPATWWAGSYVYRIGNTDRSICALKVFERAATHIDDLSVCCLLCANSKQK